MLEESDSKSDFLGKFTIVNLAHRDHLEAVDFSCSLCIIVHHRLFFHSSTQRLFLNSMFALHIALHYICAFIYLSKNFCTSRLVFECLTFCTGFHLVSGINMPFIHFKFYIHEINFFKI